MEFDNRFREYFKMEKKAVSFNERTDIFDDEKLLADYRKLNSNQQRLVKEFIGLDLEKMELLLFIAQDINLMPELKRVYLSSDAAILDFIQKCKRLLVES